MDAPMTPNHPESDHEFNLPQASLSALVGVADAPRPSLAQEEPARREHSPGLPIASLLGRPAIGDSAGPVQEADVWVGGYCGRAMIPGLLACLGVSAVVLFGLLPWLGRTMPAFRPLAGYAVLGLMGAFWVFHLFRWSYRTFTVQYRLTNRRLFCNRGCLYEEDQIVDLAQVARVEVSRHPIEHICRVGRLRLVLESSEPAAVVLGGIADPGHVANLIRQQILTARAANVRFERASA